MQPTAEHVQRGTQVRALVQRDIGNGATFEQSVANLARFLGVDEAAIRVAVAVANDA